MNKCYVCEVAINDEYEKSYVINVNFNGNKSIGGHMRTIRQHVCSKKCLSNLFLVLADQTEKD